ncbi:hypothetical protein [Sphingosinicella sp. BN140058]|uniref:hypothetical protein n=1 Tax=Sphingosinicella sp. BN140058 TaxID=1892855 RepID=UPI00101017E6|nr:hypothetical protein [Sphingosinicella sp. BN140058]QAY80386.1 hypothetical protein ETR14_27485 [Sphingosinicella sp. BN140058]
MNLRYETDLVGERRDGWRMALTAVCHHFAEDTPLGLLHDDSFSYHEKGRRDVPAKTVLPQLVQILKRSDEAIEENRAPLEALRRYVRKQIEIEKFDALADKAVAQALKARISYKQAQTRFVKALDRRTDDFPIQL